jgi:hypothetical protein
MNPEDATTSFPRGGKNEAFKTKNESSRKRSHRDGVGDDFLFGRGQQHDDVSNKKKSTRRTQKKRRTTSTTATATSSSSLLPVGGGGVVVQKNQHTMIEALSFGKLLKGTRLLGVVREVHEEYAVVSLPNLLTGYILKREVSREKIGIEFGFVSVVLVWSSLFSPLTSTLHRTTRFH